MTIGEPELDLKTLEWLRSLECHGACSYHWLKTIGMCTMMAMINMHQQQHCLSFSCQATRCRRLARQRPKSIHRALHQPHVPCRKPQGHPGRSVQMYRTCAPPQTGPLSFVAAADWELLGVTAIGGVFRTSWARGMACPAASAGPLSASRWPTDPAFGSPLLDRAFPEQHAHPTLNVRSCRNSSRHHAHADSQRAMPRAQRFCSILEHTRLLVVW